MTCAKEYTPDMIICPDDDTLLTPILTDTLIGTVLADRYEILEKLGTGGMGLVYKAKHLLMKRLVAIKLMLPHYASNATALKRFQHEAQAASHLNHPNILTVYDFGVTPQGLPYLVMDLLEGTNLSGVLEVEGYLHPDRALNIFIQTCGALGHAHQKNVIHRDLKPGNIMLVDYEGQHDWVQIVDFGMAKILSAVDGEKEDLTKAGEVFGSPMYMSPEQCMAKELDARSDIYSMGCVMYRTLTGTPAVAGSTAMECFNKHANGEPAAFASVCPEFNLSANLEAIVFKAMAKDPDDRFQTMLDLRDALMQEAQIGIDISSSMPAGTVKLPTALVERSINDTAMTPLTSLVAPGPSVQMSAGGAVKGGIDQNQVGLRTGGNNGTDSSAEITTPPTIPNARTLPSPEELIAAADNNFADQTIVPVHAPSASELKPARATTRGLVFSAIAGAIVVAIAVYATFGLGKGTPAAKGDGKATAGGATTNTEDGQDPKASLANIMAQGHAAYDHGDYTEAQNRFSAALEKSRGASDYDHGVPEARLWLGRTYFETEDFDKAREQFQELVKGREAAHQLNSLDATAAMNYLGNIYVSKKDYAQAKRWFDQSLRISKTYKGDAYGQVAETLSGMGNLAIEQGQFKQAIILLQQAEKIAVTSKTFEEVDKAKIFNALGQAYQFQGKITQAQDYYSKALAIRQKNLNPENPAIADTLVLMGTLEFGRHDLVKSEELLKRALDIQLKALGPNSLSVATTKFCLGVLYQQEKKIDQAKPLVQDAYRIRDDQLGPKDSDTVQTMKFLKSLG
ncbi:MAG: serine/threonine-protein kinase [Cyanobacteria bacterium REEB67]|nr:serine/threonine-protein kinase [Cyanobacteria bacterium REEB67]